MDSCYLDWYDTAVAQSIRQYQNHSFVEWKEMIVAKFKAYRWILVLFRGGIMKFIEGTSAR
jgi:hypothetical protein